MRDRKSDAHMKVVPAGPGMVRHHKDDNKDNNAAGNLEVMTKREHDIHTGSQTRHLRKLKRALSMPARKEKLY